MFTIEFKYDGERAQIHMLENGTVQIYSRNSENNTSKYPDLCALMPTICDKETTSFIIDCEVVAWDPKEKKILPFQQLSTRKRKDAQVDDVTVQVCLFAFDLIYRNNKSFLNESFAVRRKELVDHFKVVEGKFQFAEHKNTDSFEDIEEFMALAIKSSCEGLMVKALDLEAGYVPNKRNWLKVKKDYLDGCGDSLDLVPIAAFYGKGKRTGVYGAFLMACYDAETEEYQSICKLGTGLSDEDLKTTTAFFKEHLLEGPRPYYSYPETMKPDVWFDTKQVWEVLCADLSLSPVHKAAVGQVHESKGIALRFPRFIRLRPDKTCELATSAEQVVEFYQNQSVIGGGGDGGGGEDD
jgi:DNA ligase-1